MLFTEPWVSFSRPALTTAIVGVAGVIAAASAYYAYTRSQPSQSQKLHRSNAVRRRPRGTNGGNVNLRGGSSFSSHLARLDGAPPEDTSEFVQSDDITENSFTDDDADQVAANQGSDSFLKELTFHIAANRATNESFVHRGINCDSCGKRPIYGVRYRCANCEDFDLCELCEATADHIRTHVFYKIRVPAFWAAAKSSPTWYPGKPLEMPKELPDDVMVQVRKSLSFLDDKDVPNEYALKGLYSQFTCLADEDFPSTAHSIPNIPCGISPQAFRYLLPVTKRGALVLARLFSVFDSDGDGLISFQEFVHGAIIVQRGKKFPAWRDSAFKILDLDNDGWIDRHDCVALYQSLHEIDEDITLYQLRMENNAEDFRRAEERYGFRDFVEGSYPLPNYFSHIDMLNEHRQSPIFGQLYSDLDYPSAYIEDLYDEQTISALRDFDPSQSRLPETPAAKFIGTKLLDAFGELLDPIFHDIEVRAHRLVLSRLFRRTYQAEIDMFRKLKLHTFNEAIQSTPSIHDKFPDWPSGNADDDILRANWNIIMQVLGIDDDRISDQFMTTLEHLHPEPQWWRGFALQAERIFIDFDIHDGHGGDQGYIWEEEMRAKATWRPELREDRRLIRPTLLFMLMDDCVYFDYLERHYGSENVEAGKFNPPLFWARIEKLERENRSLPFDFLNILGLIII